MIADVTIKEGTKVNFFDVRHGFWRIGEVTKVKKDGLRIKNAVGKLYSVSNDLVRELKDTTKASEMLKR